MASALARNTQASRGSAGRARELGADARVSRWKCGRQTTKLAAAMASPARLNPWKLTTFVLAAALAVVIGGQHVATAEAAGPARLWKALSALRASKKLLDDAKDPPAPFHQQSLAVVGQAIAAVEREIKAYEGAKAKDKGDGKKDDKSKDAAKKPAASAGKKKAADDAPSE